MSVTAAQGFRASGVAARISKLGPDLALVAGDGECVGAGMFTANRVQAAPVVVSKEHLERAQPQAVVINSGQRERRDRRAGHRRRARDRRRGGARCSGSSPSRCSSSRPA